MNILLTDNYRALHLVDIENILHCDFTILTESYFHVMKSHRSHSRQHFFYKQSIFSDLQKKFH